MKKELEEGLELMLQVEKRNGQIPFVIQDAKTKEVLDVDYDNKIRSYEGLEKTLIDCDQDAVVELVTPKTRECKFYTTDNPYEVKPNGNQPYTIAVTQESETGEILMVAYLNPQAIKKTVNTGNATFFSTSRNVLWTKGEGSGNTMKIDEIKINEEKTVLVYKVKELTRGACHTTDKNGNKRWSCFYRMLVEDNKMVFIYK